MSISRDTTPFKLKKDSIYLCANSSFSFKFVCIVYRQSLATHVDLFNDPKTPLALHCVWVRCLLRSHYPGMKGDETSELLGVSEVGTYLVPKSIVMGKFG